MHFAHKPRKRFGQHFLRDHQVIRDIVAAIHPEKNDHMVEIGPGQGVLTVELLKYVDDLTAIELDRDLIKILETDSRFAKSENFHLINADILKFDFKKLAAKKPLRIVGNLPYNITTPLLFHLLSYIDLIGDMYFMVQLEVAERLVAHPHTKDYGRLSIMAQYDLDIEMLFTVPPQAFSPPPKVDSAVIRLTPKKNRVLSVNDPALFAVLVREAFNQRRKTISNALSKMVPKALWEEMNFDATRRPEEIAVDEYVKLANQLSGEAHGKHV